MNTKAFTEIMEAVTAVLPRQTTRPILKDVHISMKGGRFRAQATDLERAMTVTLPVTAPANAKPQDWLIGGKDLAAIVKSIKQEEFGLRLMDDKAYVEASGAKSVVTITNKVADYPEIAELPAEDKRICTIEHAMFLDAFARASRCVAKDEIRYALNGVWLVLDGHTATFAGTDRHRLFELQVKADCVKGRKAAIIVPPTVLRPLRSHLFGDTLSVYVTDTDLYFEGNGNVLSARIMEATYPKYREIIPKINPAKTFKVDVPTMLSVIAQARAITMEETRSIGLEINATGHEGKIVVSSRDPEKGTFSATVPIREGTKLKAEAAFDPDYLTQGLAIIGPDPTWFVNDHETAMVLTNPSTVYVLMPIRR
jgi:DNA polymerase III sliding clamp (beta) subunit (PCNA family)